MSKEKANEKTKIKMSVSTWTVGSECKKTYLLSTVLDIDDWNSMTASDQQQILDEELNIFIADNTDSAIKVIQEGEDDD